MPALIHVTFSRPVQPVKTVAVVDLADEFTNNTTRRTEDDDQSPAFSRGYIVDRNYAASLKKTRLNTSSSAVAVEDGMNSRFAHFRVSLRMSPLARQGTLERTLG